MCSTNNRVAPLRHYVATRFRRDASDEGSVLRWIQDAGSNKKGLPDFSGSPVPGKGLNHYLRRSIFLVIELVPCRKV